MVLFVDGVFEGGGVKGIGFIGAVSCLEDKGYKFYRLAGTSAGAVVAALLSAGYTGAELKKMLDEFDFLKMGKKKDAIQCIPYAGKIIGFIFEKGVFSTGMIEEWIYKTLEAKGLTCFEDVSINGKSNLKIIASDITKKKILVLPDDLNLYGINPYKFSIAKAVAMSISIPYFFKPYILRYNDGISYIVDGGLLSNYPIWIFDTAGKPKWPTFGFKIIDDKESLTKKGRKDIISYSLDIISTMLEEDEERYLPNKDYVRTINISSCGIKTTEFDLSVEKKNKLFNEGYNSADKFLKNWNFERYIKKYRMP